MSMECSGLTNDNIFSTRFSTSSWIYLRIYFEHQCRKLWSAYRVYPEKHFMCSCWAQINLLIDFKFRFKKMLVRCFKKRMKWKSTWNCTACTAIFYWNMRKGNINSLIFEKKNNIFKWTVQNFQNEIEFECLI